MKESFLGIDVSKGYADFVLIDRHKNVLEPNFQIDDTHNGHQALLRFLSEAQKDHGLDKVYAAVESTGGYENNWLAFLKQQHQPGLNLQVARLNPFGVKQDGKAGMVRTVTDATSARKIAEYLIHHPEKVNYEESAYDIFNSLRSLYGYIKMMVKHKAQLLTQLEKYIYTVCPELLVYCRENTPQWILYLLEKYPTAEAIRKASPEQLQDISRISAQKAQQIKRKTEKSVSRVTDPVIERVVKEVVCEILNRDKKIKELKNELEKKAGDVSNVAILCTFMGIGVYSAVGLLIEIEDICRFDSSKKMCSFFGVHPVFKQSGDGIFSIKMSKQGSPEVRAILYMIASAALMYNPHIKSIYDKFRSKGMKHKQAMGVVMHKILRIVYGMLKNNMPYNPEYDKSRQIKSIEREKYNMSQKVRRQVGEIDENAPVSKRQVKKRRELQTSPGSST